MPITVKALSSSVGIPVTFPITTAGIVKAPVFNKPYDIAKRITKENTDFMGIFLFKTKTLGKLMQGTYCILQGVSNILQEVPNTFPLQDFIEPRLSV